MPGVPTTLATVARRWSLLRRLRTVSGVARLLLLSQLAFNLGFYLVLPFLATHLARDLAMAGWVVGTVLGVRTFSQQGLFVVGGALADRFGVKPVVLTGCAIRIAGFVTLAVAASLPGVLLGTILTGFAAALFSPAVESALAREGAELERRGTITRAETFALFAVCGELGAVAGPVLGTALLRVDFGLTCAVAAGAFGAILLAHLRWLPRSPRADRPEPILKGWSTVLRDRTFLVFSLAYSAYLLSYNQLYLALPMELDRASGTRAALGWLFALASTMIVLGQLPLASWARARLGPRRALPLGFGLLSVAFLSVAISAPLPPPPSPLTLAPATGFVVLLTLGQMLAVPAAQDLVPRLAGEAGLGSYYGFLSSAGGIAVLLGSTVAGGLLELAAEPAPTAAVPWLFLGTLPLAGGITLLVLSREPVPSTH